ncbi:TPA: RepB family plasmid replication initiator protein [Klebsiella pneumoniae subsp. pneumoniae]|nr:RepB family plasmid replication initiator protein [Klebsiella pneumoniae subsp. pneumoniae]
MSNKINESYLNVEEINQTTGEVITLSSTSETSVQTVPLMRLGVFVPALKSTNKAIAKKSNVGSNINASDDLRHLELAKSEGFERITISGPRLDMDTDFKVWTGIISVLTDNELESNEDGTISIRFTEFAMRCGFSRGRLKAEFREKIKDSLRKLMSNVVEFSKDRGTNIEVTKFVQLIGESTVDIGNDKVILTPSKTLKDLYVGEYKILLKLRALKALARKESAQALYTFIEALPPNPIPVSIERFRKRLSLTSRPALQNSTVRKALKQLEDIGYLEYQELKEGNKIAFQIIKRNPSLK